ncbi:hypothetical protein G3A43_06235 [Paraburkholderia aspalathi]|nr:hypothetical protein [Paraburkholderia aspalathi]MBK3779846.1 hypothetical protein [Paraburkholderia aspalathi]
MAELARGSSHISSALSDQTRENAITEVTAGFVTLYGRRDLLVFVELLANALDERGSSTAAAAVRTRYIVRKPGRQPKAAAALAA